MALPAAQSGIVSIANPKGDILPVTQDGATPPAAASAANSTPHPNGVAGATGPTVSAPYGVDPSGKPYASSQAATTNNGLITTPGTTEPTAGQVYGRTGNPELDAALAAQRTAAAKAAGAPDPTDPTVQASIRAQTLASFQAEIDATNALYAEKLSQAKITGAGRLGSATAVQARSGEIGSDFGNAQTDTVNNGNNDIYNGITAEQNAAIQAILTKSKDAGTAAIAAATTARQSGLDNYVKYLQDASTRNQTNATAAANAILQAGLDPTLLTPDQLNTYVTNYGISKDDLTKAYTAAKPAYDAAKAKAAKDAQTTVAPGATVIGPDGKPIFTGPEKPTSPTSVQEFEYAVKNSGYKGSYTQWLNEDANRKNPTPKGPGPTPAQQTVIDNFGKSLVSTANQKAITDGTMTREDLIRVLTGEYGGSGVNQISPDDISKKVYETYPDKPQGNGKFLGIF